MPSRTRDELDYHIFDKEFPLGSNPLGFVIGGTGSGKSYLTYNIIIPIYIKDFKVRDILICNNTGRLDHTLDAAISNYKKIDKDVAVKFLTVEQAYQECQLIRCESMLKDMISDFWYSTTKVGYNRVLKQWSEKLKTLKNYAILHDGLYKYYKDFEDIGCFEEYEVTSTNPIIEKHQTTKEDNEEIDYMVLEAAHKYAKQLLKKQTAKIGEEKSVLMIMDDQAGERELSSSMSDFTKLMLVRRHLFLGCFILTQSIIAVNTTLRRQATVYFLLPGISIMDINLIASRLTASCNKDELIELYKQITSKSERNEQIITIFNVHPFKMVLGCSGCRKLVGFYKNVKK